MVTISTAGFGVLAVVAEGRTHGFAVAALYAADGALGRVWRIQRAVVYREFGRLTDAALLREVGIDRGPGPDRMTVEVTPTGRELVDQWLLEPVARARDARSALLLKLALLDRIGRDPGPLISAQRAVFTARLAELQARADASAPDDFERTLARWRACSTRAVLGFLDEISET
ncbi:PadR family transcriptional regulator [Flexivirga caeni]|uniref:PadR family transcriptional regulator n=1 Tax=Flexivirga caeni TaxID=2294115 RepID=A0A3M9M3B0_9MICO|nr:PadR family transcriptional regulator [Flexivirga caeni]RNI19008.1 PadR family transcriptional regulator [Flexivirga caeni]